jgi:sugar phosphate isomerase/epimerase
LLPGERVDEDSISRGGVMRFGVMAMQLGALIPTGMAPQEMMAHVAAFSHAELVRGLHDVGFDLIELGGDLGMFLPQTFAPEQIEALAVLKAEEQLAYTVHLPLWSVEPSTPLTPVRTGSARAVIETIQATRLLAPEVYVHHATGALAAEFYRMGLPPLGKAMLLRQFQQGALASLRMILEETGIPSRQLAIETVEFPLDLTLEMAEALDLSLCLDVGHVLSGFSGSTDLDAVVAACGPRLAEVHLHDATIPQDPEHPVYGLDHKPLGTADLNLGAFLDSLAAVGFDGPVIFELKVEEALASLEVVRGLGAVH